MARKIIETANIAGVELEYSKPRKGIKCKCCGRSFSEYDYLRMVKTRTNTCAVAYVCNECIEHKSYGSDLTNRDIISGKLTSGNYRFSVEIEAMYKDYNNIKSVDAFLAAQCGLQPSNDCTVDVEYHMTNRVSFHGLKDYFQSINDMVTLDSSSCGHHINLSKITWTAESMEKIRMEGTRLFGPLRNALEENPENTINLFGRYFKSYATNDNNYCHGSYLNLDNTYHIEFRLPHFKNVQQFFYCCNFCRDTVDIVDDFINGKTSSPIAGMEIVKTLHKYFNGKAYCQRAERNKVAR